MIAYAATPLDIAAVAALLALLWIGFFNKPPGPTIPPDVLVA
jgi:hypothetical protein